MEIKNKERLCLDIFIKRANANIWLVIHFKPTDTHRWHPVI